MSTFKAELRDQVLRTSPATNTSRVATSGIERKDVVYVLPGTAQEKEKYNFFVLLVLHGMSLDPTREKWRTFILTLIHLAFPAIGAKVLQDRPRSYHVEPVAPAILQNLEDAVEAFEEWEATPVANTEDRQAGRKAAAESLPVLTHLPAIDGDKIVASVVTCRILEAMYGYASLVLFLAGKTINDQNRPAISVKRPQAIERKYLLGSVSCLTGESKLSDVAHTMIHVGFVTMNHARMVVFSEVAKFSNESGDTGIEVAAVTTRLMAYSGMQHVILIDKFLSSEPEAETIPILASSLVAYASSMEELKKTPVELRPFFKLIHGDTTQAFNRKQVEPLMVVAIKTEALVNPTLQNYNLPENNNEIWTSFQQYHRAIEAHTE